VFSNRHVVAHQSPPGWAPLVVLLGKTSLLELPMPDAVRRTFARKLCAKPGLEAIVTVLLHAARRAGSSRQSLYHFDQICARCFYYNRSWLLRLRMAFYRLLLKYHRLGFPAVAWTFPALAKVSGKSHMKFQDMCSPETFQRL
jgi:hypothetical protein